MTGNYLYLNISENNENKTLMSNNDKTIILTRSIFCSLSFVSCLVLIIIYVIYCLQVKFNLCKKKEEEESNDLVENEISSDDGNKINDNKKAKIGLGSNFMFFLTLSNFLGAISEFAFYFYYMNIINNDKNKNKSSLQIYQTINNDSKCHIFGFFHNFFDLIAVCWTTMLTLLFYRSTNLSHKMLYDDNKYLLIGFLYSILSCIILCVIPIFTNSFGFARYYCSFRYSEIKDNKILEEKLINRLWRYSYILVTFINSLFNVIWLLKTKSFYSKKLEIVKKQNIKQYKFMLIYVWVFRIFPIILILSRFFKGFKRIVLEQFDVGEIFGNILEYINAFLFASNGIFDSIACIFFFRGVFWCCDSNNNDLESKNELKKPSSALDYISVDE